MQQRIRTVKPELFRHEGLHDLELETRLPIRLAWAGLFTCCDREGRFEWRPRQLRSLILPYDDVDFSRVLDAWWTRGFVVRYTSSTRHGDEFGAVPTWKRHQVLNGRESASSLPDPDDETSTILEPSPRVPHACPTRHSELDDASRSEQNRTEQNRTGTEQNDAWMRDADLLLKLYAETVKPPALDHSRSRARKQIAKLLATRAHADLKAAVTNYSGLCADKEPQYRYNAGNFFGRDELWRDFVVKPESNGHQALSGADKIRANAQRELERCQAIRAARSLAPDLTALPGGKP